ncbi:derlin-2/3 [Kwoniella mangroviensis CBS 10435]|uniref:Derlin n=1 Tax=Kwoniella mangroviensis CBS 10435 TaxID=1331196 RepID=A0A1B9IES8_9TREE|nr:derlin-2/3 [Kwoniella mangroviensis CBS 8507]OCF54045.1 derlin-2/3 [Kwoniella mangroviensis CBS 10435]OCF62781.1 derlin-2/3 [Kwoniella mangroviensis CBS 8507]OCF71121.1 derlin-2/3 [Kwoniella mangroviensis CBS 8886]
MADFSSVINAVPPVTRTLLISTAAVTFPCLLGIVSPASAALIWPRILRRYEVWRPLTSFFFGGSGFPLLYDFFLIYRNSSAMEKDVYLNNTAEYAWLHLMLGLFILTFNSLIGLPFLFRPLLHAQTYIWCRANPTLKVSIFGLLTIPTSLYPPALILLDLLTGGPMKAMGGILGLLSGHLWWFISTYLPLHAPTHLRRPNPLAPPLRFRQLFRRNTPDRSAGFGAYRPESRTTATAANDPAAAVRHRWGGGHRLGGSSL